MGKSKKKAVRREQLPVGLPDVVLSVVPVLLLAGVRSLAGPCVHTDGSAVACAFAARVETGLALAGILLAVMRLLAADRATRRSFDLFLAIAGVLIAVLPGTTLPLCADATMRCHTVMTRFARIVGGALVACALICEMGVDHEVPTGRKRRR